MKIEQRPLDAVTPYAGNPRRIPAAAVRAVAQSIERYGFRQPIVVDAEGVVIVGHTRLQAAKQLGLKTVPVHVADLTPEQAAAYRLGDNRTGELAKWDDQALAAELTALVAATSMDVAAVSEMTAFDTRELDRLLGRSKGQTDPDEVPDPPELITKPGDLWRLGRHRLMCGDATDSECTKQLMDGALADVLFTSPPYGNQREYTTGDVDWDPLMRGVFSDLPMDEGGQILVNLGLIHHKNEWQPYWESWIEWMRSQGWRRFGLYVWDQGPGLPGDWNGRLAPSFEFVFHFNRKSERPNKIIPCQGAGDPVPHTKRGLRNKDGTLRTWTQVGQRTQDHRIPDNVIRVTRHKTHDDYTSAHPAVFPVDLPAFMMDTYSHDGAVVYEPFCGSGTTLIAAERQHRACYALEIEPRYVDMAVARWEAYTGQQAERAS